MERPTHVRSLRFWLNLGGLCMLAPVATYWFSQHLQLYFAEVVVFGGAFTLWALVRLIWGLIANMTRLDVWDTSRTVLESPTVAQWLIVAALVLIVLWLSTGLIYWQLAGGRTGEFDVKVLRTSDRSPLIGRTTLNANQSVLGLPVFLHRRLQDTHPISPRTQS